MKACKDCKYRDYDLEDLFHEVILCATIHANGKLRERVVQIANEALKQDGKEKKDGEE